MCLMLKETPIKLKEPEIVYVVRNVVDNVTILSPFYTRKKWKIGKKYTERVEKVSNNEIGDIIRGGAFHTCSSFEQAKEIILKYRTINLHIFEAEASGVKFVGELYNFGLGMDRQTALAFTELKLIKIVN